jgi:hypothetical protein
MRVHGGVLTLGLVVALGLTACSGDDDDPASVEEELRDAIEEGDLDDRGNGGDPCEFVAEDEVAALFGQPAVANETGLVGPACTWESANADDPGQAIHVLQVSVLDGEQLDRRDEFDDAETIDGLGDEAFAGVGADGSLHVQFVQDGEVARIVYSTLNVDVAPSDAVDVAAARDQLIELARMAAGRM